MLEMAINMASAAHTMQTRKNTGLPYITHPFGVMQILLEEGFTSEYILSVAVLHDVFEDCHPMWREQVRKHLGMDIAIEVDSLTKDRDPQITNIKLKEASPCAQLVKLADIYHNTRGGELYAGYYEKKRKQLELLNKVNAVSLYGKVKDVLENKS